MMRNEQSTDPILRLAQRIARRADEIARRVAGDIEPWLRAEEEILGVRLPRPDLRRGESPEARREEAAIVSAC